MIRAAALALALALPGAAEASCKLALALALDISSSVNEREYRIQLQGLVAAFRTREVREAILTPPGASVAVMAFEWSGETQQSRIAGWSLLSTPEEIEAFAHALSVHDRTARNESTAIGEALAHAAASFAEAPPCARRVIDISGDGENNAGRGVDVYRAQGLLDGIVINGLAIQGAYPDPGIYYRGHVMQGPGAFVALARDFSDYPPVIIGKLIREMGTELILGQRE